MALQIQLSAADASTLAVDVLVVLVTEEPLARQAGVAALGDDFARALVEHAKRAEYKGKLEQTLELGTLGRLRARHVVLVGVGAKKDLDAARVRTATASAARCAIGLNAKTLAIVAPPGDFARALGEGVVLGA